ncbi:acyltransferase [Aliarcobacter butzleri]|uniref:acyltransferase family protein n=1 Tax=Aliarcobacter butzleri TaxID=28197 RepID=UPI001EDC0374|nr:acyltransferase [Aliarcobacter butzleri]MCG3705714.1 acyltransferase [Aliarcobacter butzleri]
MKQELYSLQFLRFIAITLVIFAHLPTVQYNSSFSFLVGGAIGVDLFFIISGFIMMYVTIPNTNSLSFFLRRFLRIAPLNIFFTLLIIIISYSLYLNPEYGNAGTLYHFPYSKVDFIYFLESIFFVHLDKTPINSIAWSLQMEFIFYSLFAICLFLGINRLLFFTIYGGLIIIYNYFNGFGIDNRFIKYLFNPLMIEFVMGVFLYKLYKMELIKPSDKVLIIFLLMIVFVFFGKFDSYSQGSFYRPLTYGMISFFIIYLFLVYEEKIKFSKIFLLFGDASYSLYLTHWTLLCFSSFFISSIEQISYYSVYISLCIMASFFIGVLVYKYIELPMHNLIRKKIKY